MARLHFHEIVGCDEIFAPHPKSEAKRCNCRFQFANAVIAQRLGCVFSIILVNSVNKLFFRDFLRINSLTVIHVRMYWRDLQIFSEIVDS